MVWFRNRPRMFNCPVLPDRRGPLSRRPGCRGGVTPVSGVWTAANIYLPVDMAPNVLPFAVLVRNQLVRVGSAGAGAPGKAWPPTAALPGCQLTCQPVGAGCRGEQRHGAGCTSQHQSLSLSHSGFFGTTPAVCVCVCLHSSM